MLLSCPAKKVTKECGLRSAEFCAPAQKAASLSRLLLILFLAKQERNIVPLKHNL